MRPRVRPRNRQPEAAALADGAALEPLEEPRDELGRDAFASVLDAQAEIPVA